jgi:hypothetical protein
MTPRPRPTSHPDSSCTRPVHREGERLDVFDRSRQFDFARIARRRHEGRARIGYEAARAIEDGDEVCADASRESARGSAHAAPIVVTPEAASVATIVGSASVSASGNRASASMKAGVGDDFVAIFARDGMRMRKVVSDAASFIRKTESRCAFPGAGEKQRCRWRGSERELHVITEVARAGRQLRRELREAAEEPQACADFHEHCIGRSERDSRRELRRPRRDGGERVGLGAGIAVAQHELGRERERCGNELPWPDSRRMRGRVRAGRCAAWRPPVAIANGCAASVAAALARRRRATAIEGEGTPRAS